MANRMAERMAGAIANRMAKPMRFGWQNDAPNPNPNPNPKTAVPCVSSFSINPVIHRTSPRRRIEVHE